MRIVSLLANNGFITYNKQIAKIVGVDEAILLGELCGLQTVYGDNFFYDQSKLVDDTCLTKYRLINALKVLKEKNILSVVKKGIPCKNYYSVNEDVLSELLDLRKTSSIKFDTTGSSNFDTTINKNKKEELTTPTTRYNAAEKYLGRLLNPSEIKVIESWVLSDEMVDEAIRQAELNNIFAIAYIDKIITRWQDNKIETVRQAEIEREQFAKKKSKGKQPEQNRIYRGQQCMDVSDDDLFEV